MDAGRLRQRITIRRQVTSKNAAGGQTRSWSDLDTVFAEIIGINGREAMIGSVLQGITTYQVKIRYREDIKPSDQIKWGATELNVHSAQDRLGTREYLEIIASTEAPQGV